MAVLAVVAVLLFGSRLPQVARNVGRSYGELRKGLTELRSTVSAEIDDIEKADSRSSRRSSETAERNTAIDDRDEPTAPRLVPPARQS